MTVNKYLPFAFIYFFINTLGLPLGLTYTAILSPFFYWWVITTTKARNHFTFSWRPVDICYNSFRIMESIR